MNSTPFENQFYTTVRILRTEVEQDTTTITEAKKLLFSLAIANGWFDDDVTTKVKVENILLETYPDNSELHTYILRRLPA